MSEIEIRGWNLQREMNEADASPSPQSLPSEAQRNLISFLKSYVRVLFIVL